MFKNEVAKFIYKRTYSRWMDEEGRRENWPDPGGVIVGRTTIPTSPAPRPVRDAASPGSPTACVETAATTRAP